MLHAACCYVKPMLISHGIEFYVICRQDIIQCPSILYHTTFCFTGTKASIQLHLSQKRIDSSGSQKRECKHVHNQHSAAWQHPPDNEAVARISAHAALCQARA